MRRIGLALVLGACACQRPPEQAQEPPPPDVQAEGDRVLLARLATWPAGGVGAIVRLEDEHGMPRTGDERDALSVVGVLDGVPREAVVRRASLGDPGYSVVVVRAGGDAAAHADVLAAAGAWIEARPATERVAVLRWGARLDQMASFTTDRTRVAAALGRIEVASVGDAVGAATSVRDQAVALARVVGGDAPRAMRSVVIVAADAPADAPTGGGQSVTVHWLAPAFDEPTLARVGSGRAFAWRDDPAAAGIASSARIDDSASGAHYDVGLCGVVEPTALRIDLAGERGHVTFTAPGALPEARTGPCNASVVARGERTYPERIELVFTAAERAVYDERVSARSKEDFDVSIRFDGGPDVARARAHLRGKGSLGCARKSYTVDFDTRRPRFLLPGSATDEVYLISMCLDDRYVRAHTVYSLMAEYGLFPLRFRFVEVALDGESRGVYMLIERTEDELIRDNGRVRSVSRRRFDPDMTMPEVDFAAGAADAAADAYWDMLDDPAGLDEVLDVDGYLRLMAFNSLLHNGDNVDEVWLVSTERARADDAVGDFFEVVGWDPDDIFAGCHYGGQYAYADEYGLSYCAEAELDDVILGDAVLYERYVGVLEQLLQTVTPARFREALDGTAAGLLPLLSQPEILAAMRELLADNPEAIEPDVADQDVRAALDGLFARFEARHALLTSRVATYRAETAAVRPGSAPKVKKSRSLLIVPARDHSH